jgi:hypothetical protein
MNKVLSQRIAFIIIAICLFFGPMLEKPGFLRYVVLAGAILYLSFGWFFPLIKDGKNYLTNEIAGFIYSTVFIANFLEQITMPGARYFTYYGYLLSLALMIFMIVKRKEVRRDMLIQSIVLFMLAPVPMFVHPVLR